MAVLQGAKGMINTFRPVVICEEINATASGDTKALLEFFATIDYATEFAGDVHTPTIVAHAKSHSDWLRVSMPLSPG